MRKFADQADIERQLVDWLHEVNHERPCDATGIVPAVALAEEMPFLSQRPLQATAADWPMTEGATVTPMGTVSYQGTSYSATAKRLGAPATLLVRRDRIDISVGDEACAHVRRDGVGEVQRLPQHREDVLAVLHGRRKVATFRRQCLLELGKGAWDFLGGLVHVCPDGQWEGPCTELYELLRKYGDVPLLGAFAACASRRTFTVDAVVVELRRLPAAA